MSQILSKSQYNVKSSQTHEMVLRDFRILITLHEQGIVEGKFIPYRPTFKKQFEIQNGFFVFEPERQDFYFNIDWLDNYDAKSTSYFSGHLYHESSEIKRYSVNWLLTFQYRNNPSCYCKNGIFTSEHERQILSEIPYLTTIPHFYQSCEK